MAAGTKNYGEILGTWLGMNSQLLELSEEECRELLAYEASHRRRKQFMLRIHSRINKVRADRERVELISKAKALQ